MSKPFLIVAIVRIVGPYLSRISSTVGKLMAYMIARTQAGINARLWMAVVMSVCALLFNVFFLQEEFDSLPDFVPIEFDAEGNISVWGSKTMLNGFSELRIAFFFLMILIAWVVCRLQGGTLMAQRLRLFIADIANLVITTGVSMAYVYILIAQGSHDEKLAEEWEYAIMGFWLLILLIEYVTDRPHIVRNTKTTT